MCASHFGVGGEPFDQLAQHLRHGFGGGCAGRYMFHGLLRHVEERLVDRIEQVVFRMEHVMQRRQWAVGGSSNAPSRCIGHPMLRNHSDSRLYEILSAQFSTHSGHG
ncbi:hypothetical protein D3C81_1797630 [compost metagenome]